MAQYWYDFTDVLDGELPGGFSEGSPPYPDGLKAYRSIVHGEPSIEFDGRGSLLDLTAPILATDRLFGDCEVLVKCIQRTFHSGNNLYNGGRFVSIRTADFSTGEQASEGLMLAIGSSGTSTVNRTFRQYRFPETDINVGSHLSLPTTPTSMDIRDRPALIRVRVVGDTITSKTWYEDTDEPADWSLTYNLSAPDGRVAIGTRLSLNSSVILAYSWISVSTDGDPLLYEPPTKLIVGIAPRIHAGGHVVARGPASGAEFGRTLIDQDGSWFMRVIDSASTPRLNLFVRADGREVPLPEFNSFDGYLAGEYPDGQTTVDGAPVSAKVQVRLRSEGPLSGVLVAEESASQDGTWIVEGLDSSLKYDVIGKLDGFNDVVISQVEPAVKAQSITLRGIVREVDGEIRGGLIVLGGNSPFTFSFYGNTPYGLADAPISVEGHLGTVTYPCRDYGDFTFFVEVKDADENTDNIEVLIEGAVRAQFADLVGSVTPPDRVSTGDMSLAVPENTQPDDLMVIAVMHRAPITVTDSNGGEWKLEGTSGDPTVYEQWTSVYTRRASADDVGATITVSCPTSGQLIPWLAVFRGRYLPLKVVSDVGSVAALGSAQPMPLTPVEHSSGLIVRCVSWPFASTAASSTRAILSGMHNVGPQAGSSAQGGLRLQIGYAHEGAPGEQNSSLDINNSNGNNIFPEVILIIDEDRP